MQRPSIQPPRTAPTATAPTAAFQVPGLVLPSSGSIPTPVKEKRGLFGIPRLGGKKAEAGAETSPFSSGGLSKDDDDAPSRGIAGFFERASVLLVLGLFAFIGVGSGVYLMFFRPDPVVIPPRVHSIPLPTPTFEPLVMPEATEFLGALPTTDLTYGLRTAEPNLMHPVTVWPSRFAEEWLLTYEDGAGGTMTVQTVQHYSLERATSAYQELLDAATAEALEAASGGASPSPTAQASPAPSTSVSPSPADIPGIVMGTVYVDKVEVGKSFKVIKDVIESVPDPAGGDPTEVTHQVAVVTWQNATGVFVMTADPAAIDDLFIEYGL